MSEKRFTVNELVKFNYSEIGEYVDENHTDRPLRNDEVVDLLNEQQATIEQLRTQLTICQQSKNDDGRFQVWEVPPIPKGMRITITTSGEKDE